jgi:sulfate transporter 4
LVAGITVGAMIIPQSMSYAKLAGLPVQYGLYSALVPVYAYSLFGSSRQLAVGPVALISLLLATGLGDLLPQGDLSDEEYTQQYATLAIQVSFLTGLLYIGMGLLQLGFVTIFLSHAVVSGFTTGAAVIIGVSQLKYIFGYNVQRSDVLVGLLHNLFVNISQFNWKTFLMGSLSIITLVILKHIGKAYPKYKWVRAAGPLAVTVLTIIFTWAFNLEEWGIPVVGNIPQGFPQFTANLWTPISDFSGVMGVVISITIVGFMESIAIGKKLAAIHKYELDSSLELIGLGMANFMGAMFQSYPVTGSFSRSAVNNDTGAESGISGMVTATIVAMVLLFLTPVFEIMVRVCLLR